MNRMSERVFRHLWHPSRIPITEQTKLALRRVFEWHAFLLINDIPASHASIAGKLVVGVEPLHDGKCPVA